MTERSDLVEKCGCTCFLLQPRCGYYVQRKKQNTGRVAILERSWLYRNPLGNGRLFVKWGTV